MTGGRRKEVSHMGNTGQSLCRSYGLWNTEECEQGEVANRGLSQGALDLFNQNEEFPKWQQVQEKKTPTKIKTEVVVTFRGRRPFWATQPLVGQVAGLCALVPAPSARLLTDLRCVEQVGTTQRDDGQQSGSQQDTISRTGRMQLTRTGNATKKMSIVKRQGRSRQVVKKCG